MPPPSRPTMRQISQLAGVSQSTVSRILSGSDFNIPIAAETRQRVLAIVAQLGYTPNPLARALRGGRTSQLGLIVRDVADPFFALAIDAVTGEARRHGYGVVLGHAHSRAAEAAALQEALASTQHCDGTIVLGDLRDEPELWSGVVEGGLPLVGLCQGGRSPRMPVVNVDNAAGARLALQHLYDLGHRRIAFVQGGWIGDGRERLNAYGAFMRAHGLRVPDGYSQPSDNDLPSGAAAARALLSLPRPPTAIFAASDVVALGVLKGASLVGVGVPSDVSIVGFDDIPMAAFAIPSLTTVRQPIEDMARLAVSRLLALIAQPASGVETPHLLAPALVTRDSSAAPGLTT